MKFQRLGLLAKINEPNHIHIRKLIVEEYQYKATQQAMVSFC